MMCPFGMTVPLPTMIRTLVITVSWAVRSGMPALYASSITPFIAVGEAGIEKMMSTPSWIIWRICWIWTSFAPFESVTTRSPSTRPCSFAAAKFSCSDARAAARQALPEKESL